MQLTSESAQINPSGNHAMAWLGAPSYSVTPGNNGIARVKTYNYPHVRILRRSSSCDERQAFKLWAVWVREERWEKRECVRSGWPRTVTVAKRKRTGELPPGSVL
jgi:hypothetical protein